MFIGGNEDNTSIEENQNDSIVNAVEEKLNQASSKPDKMSEETKVDSTAQEIIEAAEVLDAIR